MREFVDIAKAISDPSRIRILLALRGRELCVCQLVELLGLANSTVSKHMALLHHAHLVDCRRDGRWAFYRRADAGVPARARAALGWLDASMEDDAEARADERRLRTILRTPVEQLCRIARQSEALPVTASREPAQDGR